MYEDSLVSIIIPTHNRCALLRETLRSVMEQSHRNWEAIVVDDASTDTTWEMLQELSGEDTRIRPIAHNGHRGGADIARNQGFSASAGDFILFLDSDDLLVPSTLQGRLAFFEQFPAADAIVGNDEYFRNSPGEFHSECVVRHEMRKGIPALNAFLTGLSLWQTSGPLWRRSAIEMIGPWETSHDNQYHTRALALGITFIHTDAFDLHLRQHGGAHLSRRSLGDHAEKIRVLDGTLHLLRAQSLMNRRTKRMLTWSIVLHTLTIAIERAVADKNECLQFLSVLRERSLSGDRSTFCMKVLASIQWSMVFGRLPRELLRFIVFLDLRQDSFIPSRLVRNVADYARYLFHHSRNMVFVERFRSNALHSS